jgi:hypothetical protein
MMTNSNACYVVLYIFINFIQCREEEIHKQMSICIRGSLVVSHVVSQTSTPPQKILGRSPLDLISKNHRESGNHHANLFQSWLFFFFLLKMPKITFFSKAPLCTFRMVEFL